MGLGSTIGKFINSASGATDAAATNWKYQKQAMQNAHQWEVKDLEKAGLNPIYSANSNGATTGGVSPGMQPGGTGILNSAMTAMTEGAKLLQNQDKVNAEVDNLNSDTANKKEENPWIAPQAKAAIGAQESKTGLNSAMTATESKKQQLIMSEIGLNMQEKSLKSAQTGLTQSERRHLEGEIKSQKMRLKKESEQLDVDLADIAIQKNYLNSSIGKGLKYINMGASDLKPAAQIVGGAIGGYSALNSARGIAEHGIRQERNYTTINNYENRHRRH